MCVVPHHSDASCAVCGHSVWVFMVEYVPAHRHPLDQQNTSLMRALPGLELVAKTVMGEQQQKEQQQYDHHHRQQQQQRTVHQHSSTKDQGPIIGRSC